MDKLKLKNHLRSIERQAIEEAEMNYEDFLTTNLLDRTEVIEQDDQSHHRASLEVSDSLDHHTHEHINHLKLLDEIDFGPKDVVEPGAVIKANGRYLVVAVPKPSFSFEGKDFLSISTKSPVYNCLKGKKVGDTCQFNQVTFKIEELY